jgi:head-tail adaptor
MRRQAFTKTLTLQSRTTEHSDFGSTDEQWTDQVTVYAAISPFISQTRQGEQIVGGGLESIATHKITFAATPTTVRVRSGWRAVGTDGRVFDLDQVITDEERNRTITALAREVRS